MDGLRSIEQVLRERQQFEADMRAHVARLCSYAGPYVSALTSADRDAFFDAALDQAWQRRAGFHPASTSLYQWWEECLRAAALTRDFWYARHGAMEVRRISGRRLGANGPPPDSSRAINYESWASHLRQGFTGRTPPAKEM